MSVWNVAPIDSQPELTLIRWQMIEVQMADVTPHYLVGYCLQNNEGRVTSAVFHFNLMPLTAVTHSGRTYQLSGPPGNDRDACHVWERLAANSGITEWTDTVEQIWLAYERTQMTSAARTLRAKRAVQSCGVRSHICMASKGLANAAEYRLNCIESDSLS